MTPPRLALLAILLVVPALAGCWRADDDGGEDPPPLTGTTPQPPPLRLTFGGQVVDALSGEPLPDATVRLDLAQTRPCRREGVLWNVYELPVDEQGRYGPFELPVPRSDDVAFFLHATAPGHSENATFIGPADVPSIHNMTVVLHPDVALEGRAPPGTVVALAAPGFPRLAVADANGTFLFEHARAVEAAYVVATEPPLTGRVTPPATLDAPSSNGTVWRLEGTLRDASGAPVAGDVVAWNGSDLASAGRAGPNGVFVLPLAPTSQDLLLEARTPEGRLGGVLRLTIDGPPATRQNVVMRALC